MLTATHKQQRVEWANNHINDDWSRTLFSDETAFQLFRNTVERWHKGTHQVRAMPKDRTKFFAWGFLHQRQDQFVLLSTNNGC